MSISIQQGSIDSGVLINNVTGFSNKLIEYTDYEDKAYTGLFTLVPIPQDLSVSYIVENLKSISSFLGTRKWDSTLSAAFYNY